MRGKFLNTVIRKVIFRVPYHTFLFPDGELLEGGQNEKSKA